MQPTSTTCGQARIAMITGKPVQELIQAINRRPYQHGQLTEALDFYGAPHVFSLLTVHTNAGYPHWVLLREGKHYAPEFSLIGGAIPSFPGIHESTGLEF